MRGCRGAGRRVCQLAVATGRNRSPCPRHGPPHRTHDDVEWPTTPISTSRRRRTVGPSLQTGLQRLARPWYRVQALRVFRDDTGLAVNPHLWASTRPRLTTAPISYCSPLRRPPPRPGSIARSSISALTMRAGPSCPCSLTVTLVWDDARRDYNSMASSALPPALAGRFADEPRHLDLRWARDETQLDLRHSRFREAVADLAAPMHHLPKDELESEDVRRHRRALRLARAAVAVLVVLMLAAVVTGGLAVRNANRADESAREARAQAIATLSRQLAASSANVPTTVASMSRCSSRSLPTERRPTPKLAAVRLARSSPTDAPTYLHGFGSDVEAAFAPSGRTVAATDSRRIRVWNVATGRLLFDQPTGGNGPPGGFSLRLSADGSTPVAGNQGGTITIWNVDTGRIERSLRPSSAVEGMALSSDGSTPASGGSDGTIMLWDVKAATRLRSISSSQASILSSALTTPPRGCHPSRSHPMCGGSSPDDGRWRPAKRSVLQFRGQSARAFPSRWIPCRSARTANRSAQPPHLPSILGRPGCSSLGMLAPAGGSTPAFTRARSKTSPLSP